MLLTICAARSAALADPRDLGYLLHKHPDRVQSFEVYGGTAHVFYPEVDDERCTAAMMLEIDPIALVRGRSGARDGFALGHYVNDRPYVASSLLSVAMAKVFGSALKGRCDGHEDLAGTPLDLTLTLPVVPGEPGLVRRLFEPMGWSALAEPIALDATRPEWGDAPLVSLSLSGTHRLADALNHLYVLLPVLDDAKHYWVHDDEVDKLVRSGSGWLAMHPERDLITSRYLAHQRSLSNAAIERLSELDDRPSGQADDDESPARTRPLVQQRHAAVLDVIQELRPESVVDLGCGQGALLRALMHVPGVARVVGTEVSDTALTKAAKRLHVEQMTERQSERLTLLLSSLQYEDDRLEGFDVAVLMEVIEHIDPVRLSAVAGNVFGAMHPRHVIVTTPNADYNGRYPGLVGGGLRHPDHRFEWTRAQFADWTNAVADAHGYDVQLRLVGDVDEDLGSPTQMAVFSRMKTPGESS